MSSNERSKCVGHHPWSLAAEIAGVSKSTIGNNDLPHEQ